MLEVQTIRKTKLFDKSNFDYIYNEFMNGNGLNNMY